MGSFGRAAVIAALLVGVLAVSVSIGGGLAYLVERAASAPEPNAPPIAAAVAASPPRPDPRLETVIAALERSEARLQAALDLLTARAIPPTPFEQFPPTNVKAQPPKSWRAKVRKTCDAAPLK